MIILSDDFLKMVEAGDKNNKKPKCNCEACKKIKPVSNKKGLFGLFKKKKEEEPEEGQPGL